MTPELLTRILRMMRRPPVAGVSLHLGGEPLLHPRIDYLVRLVHDHLGERPRIATNGTLLVKDLSRRIAGAGGANLEIDFCGDPAVFTALRGGADWERVHDNIANAVDAGLPIALVALDGDVERLRSVFGDAPGLSYGHFRMHNCGGNFAGVMEKRFSMNIDRRRPYPCTHPWFSMAVAWDGSVVVCCRDVLHEHVVGDLVRQTIAGVWRGPELRRVRGLHARSRLEELPLCRTCDRPFAAVNRPWNVIRRYSPRWKP